MKLIKPKKYLGLCQCKGCKKQFITIVAMWDKNLKFYPAYLCEYHAYDAIKFDYLED